MIRFSAALVVVGLGLLLAGALTSELSLVYAAIAVSVLAAATLAVGVIAGRDEILGRDKTAESGRRAARPDAVAETAPEGATAGDAAVNAGSLPRVGTGPASAFQARTPPRGSFRLAATALPGSGDPAAAAAPGTSAGAGSSGLGWPSGPSPTEALWARVDAELAAAGAAVGAPKLTKDSDTEEVWDRVELELSGPARWNAGLRALRAAGPAPGERFALARPLAPRPPAPRSPGSLGITGPGEPAEPEVVGQDMVEAVGQDTVKAVGQDTVDDQPAPDEGTRAGEQAEAGGQAGTGIQQAAYEAAGPAETGVVSVGREASDPEASETEASQPVLGVAGVGETGAGETGAGETGAGETGAGQPVLGDPVLGDLEVGDLEAGEAGADQPVTADPVTADPMLGDPVTADPEAGQPVLGDPVTGDPEVSQPVLGDPMTVEAGAVEAEAGEAEAVEAEAVEAEASDPGVGEALGSGQASDWEMAASEFPAPRRAADEERTDRESGQDAAAHDLVVLVPGVPRYHRGECILIRFLGTDDVESLTREQAQAAGCVPCRACQPDTVLTQAE